MGFGRGRGFSPIIDKWRKYASKSLAITAPTITSTTVADSIGGYTAEKALTIPTPNVSATAAVV